MRISWVILTWNRLHTVKKAFEHNSKISGRKCDELIWVDNGSEDGTYEYAQSKNPDVLIRNKENLGVAKGYNRALLLASGSHIAITGCDMMMPDGWLEKMAECFERIPSVGFSCIYSVPVWQVPERARGPTHEMYGIKIRESMPIERRLFRRDLLEDIGFMREDLGLYGWEDCYWAYRAEAVLKKKGLKSYVLEKEIATHLGDKEVISWAGMDNARYRKLKDDESNKASSAEILERGHREGYEYVNPYCLRCKDVEKLQYSHEDGQKWIKG